ncbi:MAG: pilus assembly protein [Hyphomicrobiaceae bacterium]
MRLQHLFNRAKRFDREEGGSVAIVFALTATAVFGVVGLAVDYGRAMSMHARIQQVADAAALKGALILKNTNDEAKAKAAAESHFNALLSDNGITTLSTTGQGGSVPPLQVTTSMADGSVRVVASTPLETYFMGLMGINEVPINVDTVASTAVKNIDIGLMIDVTGSMGWADNTISTADCAEADGTKLGAARCASKDFLEILMPQGDNTRVKMAIAPFSQYVKLGRTRAATLTGLPETRSAQNWKVRKKYNSTCTNSNWYTKSSCYNTNTYYNGDEPSGDNDDRRSSGGSWTEYLKSCIAERKNRDATDNTPVNGDWDPGYQTSSSDTCTPNDEVMPLTSTKANIQAKIDSLTTPTGGTAGHIGTAWAWYTISPNFASLWPASSQPAAYEDDKTLKAVLLLTDGDYTMHNSVSGCNGSDPCSPARQDARSICTSMKAKGVMVFAVGFGLAGSQNQLTPAQIAALQESDGRKVLADCAGEGRYFFPYNGAQLRQAFSDVATAMKAVLGEVRVGQANATTPAE